MPLEVIYLPKQTSIFSEIAPFVDKLVAQYKQSQETKWFNEWTLSAIADIEKANKPQEVIDFLDLANIPEENLDLEGFKKFAPQAIGMLKGMDLGKYTQPGAKAIPGVTEMPDVTQATTAQPTGIMPDVKEFNSLYKFVSELPTGKVDWTNTLDVFKKKLESGREMGDAARQFLSMIMGESMPVDQRQKVEQDVGFAKDLQRTLFPKPEKPSSELEYWLEEHPEQGVEDYWRAKEKPEKTFDVETFLEDEPDWEIGTIDSKTGDVTLRRKDSTKKWEFDTWKEAQEFAKTHQQPGFEWKIETQGEGFNITAVKKDVPTPKGETDKLVPTHSVLKSIVDDLTNPGMDYEKVLHNAKIKYNLEGIELPSKADQAKVAYDKFGAIIIGEEYIDLEGFVLNEEAYADYYADYERYAKKYFEETGQILPKKYLSLEEAGKYTGLTWGKGEKGGNKPILNKENIPWSWQKEVDVTQEVYNEMRRNDLRPEDCDLEGLAKEQGVDIERLLQMFKK